MSAARELLSKGDMGGMLTIILAAAWGKVDGREDRGGEDNKIVGVEGEDLESVVKAIVDGQ